MEFFLILTQAVTWLIIIDAISSWVVGPDDIPRSLTRPMVEPLYRPIRAVLDPSKTGGLDLSPLIWLLGLEVLRQVVARSAFAL